jgi:hypothetical protein
MALNAEIHTYYAYSFQAVAESDSGLRLFLYGEANKTLSLFAPVDGAAPWK